MPLNRQENEEQYLKLRDKTTSKVFGITTDIGKLMDSSDDIGFNFVQSSIESTAGQGNIVEARSRIRGKETDLENQFVEVMENMGKRYVHSIPYNERTRLIRESNYMLTQMPQLHNTFANLTKFIMSPDNYSEEELIQDIYLKSDSAFTQSDINAILEERGLYKLVNDSILASLELGYRFIELIPLQNVAKKLLDRVSGSKVEQRQIIEGKMAQGQRVIPGGQPQLYGMSHIDKIEDVVFYGESENIVIPANYVKLYRESYNGTSTQRREIMSTLYDAIDEAFGMGKYSRVYETYSESFAKPIDKSVEAKEKLASQFFTESVYSPNHKEKIAHSIHMRLMGESNENFMTTRADKREVVKQAKISKLYAEATDDADYKKALAELKKNTKSKRKSKIKDMTGCYVSPLDDEKTYPVIVNKELIGVYYIDTFMDYAANKSYSNTINNVLGSNKFGDSGDYKDNPIVRKDIIEGLSNILTEHMDANFVTENRRILGSMLKVLEENDMYKSQFRIRFIPRKYLVPFQNEESNNGIGKSKLLYARIPILFWTLLQQDKMMTKLFYEKDKLAIKYRTTFAQSLFNDRNDAMEIFTDLFPLPSELTDFTRVHSSMATIGRLLIPIDKAGNELFSVDRIEGQKYDNSNDDFMKNLETIIEDIVGFPMSTLNQAEKTYDYATSIIAQDGRLVQMITNLQVHYAPMATELATKIARYETGEDDTHVEITFPVPKLLTSNISNENAQKFEESLNNIMKMYYGEEDTLSAEKKLFIRRELIKELFPAYDHSEELEQIEEKWKVHKLTFKDNLKEEGQEE